MLLSCILFLILCVLFHFFIRFLSLFYLFLIFSLIVLSLKNLEFCFSHPHACSWVCLIWIGSQGSFVLSQLSERERERETGGGVECLRLFCVRVSKEGSFEEEEEEEEGEISWSLGSLLWAHTRFFSCLSDIGVNCVLYVVLLCHLGII